MCHQSCDSGVSVTLRVISHVTLWGKCHITCHQSCDSGVSVTLCVISHVTLWGKYHITCHQSCDSVCTHAWLLDHCCLVEEISDHSNGTFQLSEYLHMRVNFITLILTVHNFITVTSHINSWLRMINMYFTEVTENLFCPFFGVQKHTVTEFPESLW